MNVTIHWERSYRVLDQLIELHEEKKPPFDKAQVPQREANLPRGLELGGLQHARYLFIACYYMKGPINSEYAFQKLKEVWNAHRRLFDPVYVTTEKLSPRSIRNILEDVKLTYDTEQIGLNWVFNAHKLMWYWKADPRNLFREAEDFSVICNRLIHSKKAKKNPDIPWGFKGFREKMVSMLWYFYRDADMLEDTVMPAPIDFHLFRIMTSCQMLTIPNPKEDRLTEEYKAAARKLTVEYAKDRRVEMAKIAEAMWLFSRNACRYNPGNKVVKKKQENGKVVFRSAKILWSNKQRRNHDRSCRFCPLQTHCKFNVPSAPYYKEGKLKINGERTEPPIIMELH